MSNNPTIILFAVSALAACGTPVPDKGTQRSGITETFSFRSSVDPAGRKASDPDAERARIKELERHLLTHRMCPKGYEITSRRAIIQIGEKDQVNYHGRCST